MCFRDTAKGGIAEVEPLLVLGYEEKLSLRGPRKTSGNGRLLVVVVEHELMELEELERPASPGRCRGLKPDHEWFLVGQWVRDWFCFVWARAGAAGSGVPG